MKMGDRALCDQAPIVDIPANGHAKPVSIVMPYYENPKFLEKQMRHWLGWDEDIQSWVKIVIVDDGSPYQPASSVIRSFGRDFPIKIDLYRIDVDERWNWIAARNIGMTYANGWCVLTDMDHMIPEVTMECLIRGEHRDDTIYRFSRTERGEKPIHPHPNSWFMTKQMFWKTGGYDEALSGYYGTDGEYRSRCAGTAPIRILTNTLDRYEHQLDASTSRYLRKQPEDAEVKRIISKRKKGWKPRTLSFPYHQVEL